MGLHELSNSGKGRRLKMMKKLLSYTAQIADIFVLGAGDDPDLPPDLRESSTNLDKTSIVLRTYWAPALASDDPIRPS